MIRAASANDLMDAACGLILPAQTPRMVEGLDLKAEALAAGIDLAQAG
jgi:hypothetical protein